MDNKIDYITIAALSTALRDRARDAYLVFDETSRRPVVVSENKGGGYVELKQDNVYPISLPTVEAFRIDDNALVLGVRLLDGTKRVFRLLFLHPAELEGNMEGLEGKSNTKRHEYEDATN